MSNKRGSTPRSQVASRPKRQGGLPGNASRVSLVLLLGLTRFSSGAWHLAAWSHAYRHSMKSPAALSMPDLAVAAGKPVMQMPSMQPNCSQEAKALPPAPTG